MKLFSKSKGKTIGEMMIGMNTRKLSKTFKIFSAALDKAAEEMIEMDLKGCPECGSRENELLERIENAKPFMYLDCVLCCECNKEFVMDPNGNVIVEHRK